MKNGVALALLLALCGCGSLATVSDYDWVKQQDFRYRDVDWVVLDRPQESRLMLRPSIADEAAAGQMAKDLGVAKTIDGFDQVVGAWFQSVHRRCAITGTDVLSKTWRQYRYSCS